MNKVETTTMSELTSMLKEAEKLISGSKRSNVITLETRKNKRHKGAYFHYGKYGHWKEITRFILIFGKKRSLMKLLLQVLICLKSAFHFYN